VGTQHCAGKSYCEVVDEFNTANGTESEEQSKYSSD
jgi:hypothetical protein